jgi:hypothetical protein
MHPHPADASGVTSTTCGTGGLPGAHASSAAAAVATTAAAATASLLGPLPQKPPCCCSVLGPVAAEAPFWVPSQWLLATPLPAGYPLPSPSCCPKKRAGGESVSVAIGSANRHSSCCTTCAMVGRSAGSCAQQASMTCQTSIARRFGRCGRYPLATRAAYLCVCFGR